MNDFTEGTKFYFGKIELGVIPEEVDVTVNPIHKKPVNDKRIEILNKKQDAIDVLDELKYAPYRTITDKQYRAIRDVIEAMAEYIRNLDAPITSDVTTQAPSKGKSNKHKRNRHKGGNKKNSPKVSNTNDI